jgi:rubrerythrin
MRTESALAVLRSAIQNEVAGQRFYEDASFYCFDPRAKEAFAALAKDEAEHTRLLLLEYEALSSRGRWIDPASALTTNAQVDITRFAFPDGPVAEELFPPERPAERSIDRRSDDMDTLAFGVHMERKAIELYGRATLRSQDAAARQAYDFLVEEETRHMRELKAHWERLAGIPWP